MNEITMTPRNGVHPGAQGIRPPAAAAKPIILLADDDIDSRDLIEYHLRRAGYDVLLAQDGAEVFSLIESHEPMLFLLDCRMPCLDGFECCLRLKNHPRFSEHPVVFLTALTEPESTVRGFEVGGVDYVHKPVIVQELLARIRTHVDLAMSRRALRGRADSLEVITADQLQRLDEVRVGQDMLLTDPTRFPELKLGLRFQPAYVAGGDFYEIARLNEDEMALFIADVSGHDLSMPFVTGGLKALMASFLNEALSPEETMIQLNASLKRFLPDGRFVSACYARFSRSQMRLSIINAGHPFPLYYPAGGPPHFVALIGDVLGIFETTQFQSTEFQVQPADRLFLFTDGVTEGFRDAAGQVCRSPQGMNILRDFVVEHAAHTVQQVADQLLEKLTGDADEPLGDDVVILGVEF